MSESYEEFRDRIDEVEYEEDWRREYVNWKEQRIADNIHKRSKDIVEEIDTLMEQGMDLMSARLTILESWLIMFMAENDVHLEVEDYEYGLFDYEAEEEPKLQLIKNEEEE